MTSRHSFSSAISGVLYAEDFDEPGSRPASLRSASASSHPEPEIIAPSFTLDELRAASEQAREEGRDVERLAAEQSRAALLNAAFLSMSEQLRQTQEHATRLVEENMEAVARTTLSVLTTALPSLCAQYAQTELQAVLLRVLPTARQLPELQIRVNPLLRETMESQAAPLFEGTGTRVVWTESSKLPPGDILIQWQNGSAVRDTAATCAGIHAALLASLNQHSDKFAAAEAHHGQ